MIDNYEELTVDETLDAVSDFDESEIRDFIAFERDNKDRSTVVDPLEAQVESTDDSDETDTSDDETPTVIRIVDEEVEVTHANGYGYAGGLWFDDEDETQTVERTTRIQRAIESGMLEEVE